MAQFSAKERIIANMLSAFPGIKRVVKDIYVRLNAVIYKKDYIEKVLYGKGSIAPIWNGGEESFYGYYDKSPENGKGDILAHLSNYNTKNKPTASSPINIVIIHTNGEKDVVDETYSYNWQQGARTMWLDDDLVMYNSFDGEKYIAKVYSQSEKKIVRQFPYPVQDAYGKNFYLSINYRKIMFVRPDYGYRNLPALTENDMMSFNDAGIIKVDYATGQATTLYSMEDILSVEPKEIFKDCFHVVNHLMISPQGNGLVFVHRFYEGKVRHDRLMYSDGKHLSCVLDDDNVSHYCWLDEGRIFGYVRVEGTDGFYTINVKTKETQPCEALNTLQTGDGHPTYCNGKIIVDTYPDKSRMQHLMMLDLKTQEIKQIVEVYQSVKYMNETRCDMHPRFAKDGKCVYFDSVYNGKRELCKFDLQ